MTRKIKRGGKVWINVYPDKPVTKKPAETRMGSGKGSPEGWVAVVKPGRVMFELAGVPSRSPARRSGWPATSCPSRRSSSCGRTSHTDGQALPSCRDMDDAVLVERLRTRGASCSGCASSTRPASSRTPRAWVRRSATVARALTSCASAASMSTRSWRGLERDRRRRAEREHRARRPRAPRPRRPPPSRREPAADSRPPSRP